MVHQSERSTGNYSSIQLNPDDKAGRSRLAELKQLHEAALSKYVDVPDRLKAAQYGILVIDALFNTGTANSDDLRKQIAEPDESALAETMQSVQQWLRGQET